MIFASSINLITCTDFNIYIENENIITCSSFLNDLKNLYFLYYIFNISYLSKLFIFII